MKPPLSLLAGPIVEDADDPGSHVESFASSAHDAERAHVFIVAEDVVLFEPEALREATEPLEQRVEPADLARQWVVSRHVPHDVCGDELPQRVAIARSKSLRSPPVRSGV